MKFRSQASAVPVGTVIANIPEAVRYRGDVDVVDLDIGRPSPSPAAAPDVIREHAHTTADPFTTGDLRRKIFLDLWMRRRPIVIPVGTQRYFAAENLESRTGLQRSFVRQCSLSSVGGGEQPGHGHSLSVQLLRDYQPPLGFLGRRGSSLRRPSSFVGRRSCWNAWGGNENGARDTFLRI